MSDRELHKAKWMSLREKVFRNRHGGEGRWEYVTREGTRGAVTVVAVIPGDAPALVLVRQFRPPAGDYVLEFPAGLLDTGEEPGPCALRELAEETGYTGTIADVGPQVYNSPGLTDETVAWVRVNVTAQAESRPEADEDIEVVLLPLDGLDAKLRELAAEGQLIDAKLWWYAMGQQGG